MRAAPGSASCGNGRPYDTLRNAIVDAPFLPGRARRGLRRMALCGRQDRRAGSHHCGAPIAPKTSSVVFLQRSRGYAPRRRSPIGVREHRRAGEDLRPIRRGRSTTVTANSSRNANPLMPAPMRSVRLLRMSAARSRRAEDMSRVGRDYRSLRRGSSRRARCGGWGRRLDSAGRSCKAFSRTALIERCFAESILRPRFFAARLRGRSAAGGAAHRYRSSHSFGLARGCSVRRRLAIGDAVERAVQARPGPVPGYGDPVIMSSGAFVGGATIDCRAMRRYARRGTCICRAASSPSTQCLARCLPRKLWFCKV